MGRAGEHATVMPLEPMGTDETSVLVENLLRGGDLPSEIRERIVTQAEGLPLYAEEIVSALVDEGYLVLRGGRLGPSRPTSRSSPCRRRSRA